MTETIVVAAVIWLYGCALYALGRLMLAPAPGCTGSTGPLQNRGGPKRRACQGSV